MRGEGVREPELGGEHGAEVARSENPDRNVGPGGRNRLDALTGNDRREERFELEHVLGKVFRSLRRTAERAQGELVGSRRAAEAEVDAAGK